MCVDLSTAIDASTAAAGLPRRVLFVQHAGCLGGSATSLRYLVEGMRGVGVEGTVALARPSHDLEAFYAAAGIPTVRAPDICCWDHSTVAPRHLTNPRHLLDLASVAARWRSSRAATLRLVEQVGADLVHLNSMPLGSSAAALVDAGVPFVWHVREPPPDQGLRTAAIRRLLLRAPVRIFISRHDKQAWIGDAPARIVSNCVPDDWFAESRPCAADGLVRFAYLGGFSIAKGVGVLAEALALLRERVRGWRCVMPWCLPDAAGPVRERPVKRAARMLGYRTLADRLRPRLAALAPEVELRPFTRDVRSLLATVDFLLFPAVQPHFPRPVIEAAALGRPAIGSRIGGVDECIDDGVSGVLCPPRDPAALAAAIGRYLEDGPRRQAHGAAARDRARRLHSLSAQVAAVADAYRESLGRPSGSRAG
jgi:glycosyltransferase involved in cell wall biosynthesis